MNKTIDTSNRVKEIIKEAENIINNNIKDETKLRKMIGQILVDEMQSTIDKWDGLEIPDPSCDIILHSIFEYLLEKFIYKKLDRDYNSFAEYRNIDWGDGLIFITPNSKIKTLNVLDKNNNIHKKEIIDGKITLEINNVFFPFEDMYRFVRNKISIKEVINLAVKDIKRYIDEKINILQDNTQIINLLTEKPVKIGMSNCFLVNKDMSLCLCIKIGIGMLGV